MSLLEQRCLNHSRREAVARCPECEHYYCRECVTEYGDGILCAACLNKQAKKTVTSKSRIGGVLKLGQCIVAVFMLWFIFLGLGRALLSMPDDFHEGTYWHVDEWDEE